MQEAKLKMRISYEANRLAEINLRTAYEKLIPAIKMETNRSQAFEKNDEVDFKEKRKI